MFGYVLNDPVNFIDVLGTKRASTSGDRIIASGAGGFVTGFITAGLFGIAGLGLPAGIGVAFIGGFATAVIAAAIQKAEEETGLIGKIAGKTAAGGRKGLITSLTTAFINKLPFVKSCNPIFNAFATGLLLTGAPAAAATGNPFIGLAAGLIGGATAAAGAYAEQVVLDHLTNESLKDLAVP